MVTEEEKTKLEIIRDLLEPIFPKFLVVTNAIKVHFNEMLGIEAAPSIYVIYITPYPEDIIKNSGEINELTGKETTLGAIKFSDENLDDLIEKAKNILSIYLQKINKYIIFDHLPKTKWSLLYH